MTIFIIVFISDTDITTRVIPTNKYAVGSKSKNKGENESVGSKTAVKDIPKIMALLYQIIRCTDIDKIYGHVIEVNAALESIVEGPTRNEYTLKSSKRWWVYKPSELIFK